MNTTKFNKNLEQLNLIIEGITKSKNEYDFKLSTLDYIIKNQKFHLEIVYENVLSFGDKYETETIEIISVNNEFAIYTLYSIIDTLDINYSIKFNLKQTVDYYNLKTNK